MAVGTAERGAILLVDKPAGINSFAIIARLRKFIGIRRIGYAGTLDPFAAGLVPVCIGRAARMIRFMDAYDKTYRLTVSFGRATDTLDPTGQTTAECAVPGSLLDAWKQGDFGALEHAAAGLTGPQMQVPPAFSAVKIEGRPLYAYARAGQTPEAQPRPVVIRHLELTEVLLQPDPAAVFIAACSKGTYMRVLAADIGAALGLPAHASALVRLASGPYRLEHAVTVSQLDAWWDALPDQAAFWQSLAKEGVLLEEASALAGLPELELDRSTALDLISGRPAYVPRRSGPDQADSPRLVCRHAGQLIAVAALRGEADGRQRIISERVLYDHADLRDL